MKKANGPRGSVKKKRLTEMLSLSGLLGGEGRQACAFLVPLKLQTLVPLRLCWHWMGFLATTPCLCDFSSHLYSLAPKPLISKTLSSRG